MQNSDLIVSDTEYCPVIVFRIPEIIQKFQFNFKMQTTCAPIFDEKNNDTVSEAGSIAHRSMHYDLDAHNNRETAFKDRKMAEYDANGHRIHAPRTEASEKSTIKSRKKRQRKDREKSERNGYLKEDKKPNGNPKKPKKNNKGDAQSDSKYTVEKSLSAIKNKRYEHVSPRYLSHLEPKIETAVERSERESQGPNTRSRVCENVTKAPRLSTTPSSSRLQSSPPPIPPPISPKITRSTTPESETDIIDLEGVSDTRRLETVEGRQILKTFLATSTPRFGRMLKSERKRPKYDSEARTLTYPSSTSSEDSGSEFAWERRKRRQRMDRMVLHRAEFLVSELDRPGTAELASGKHRTIPNACAPAEDNTLSAAIVRWHQLEQSRGKRSGLLGLLVLYVAFLYRAQCFTAISRFWVSSLPYCSSEVNLQMLPQPTSDTSQHRSFWTCRKCVLHGVCRNGVVEDCVSSYTLQYGICVRSKSDLDNITVVANKIENAFSDNQIATTICAAQFIRPRQISSFLYSVIDNSSVSINDIKNQADSLGDRLGTFEHSSGSLSQSHVISALDLIAVRTPGLLIQTNESVIVIPRFVSTLSCATKAVFISYLFPIGGAIGFFFLVATLWKHWLLKKTEQSLTQHFCNQIRQTLKMRIETQKSKTVSAHAYVLEDEMRANLLGRINIPRASKDHPLDALWRKIVKLVDKDAQILSRNIE